MNRRSDEASTTRRTMISPGPDQPEQGTMCLVVIHGEGLGKRIDVPEQPIVIGRSHDADLHIPHVSVSRQHCQVWREGNACHVRDLGATNRTRINDLPVEHGTLSDGDHLTIGESILKFIGEGSVEARYHEEVYQVATHDALTGLCNRRHFIEIVDKEISRSLRHERPLAMCIVDVDLFKPINDTYGHIAGDGVLRQIGEIMRNHVRGDDIAARIGGEEFAVLLPEAGIEAAGTFAERLRQAVAESSFTLGDQPHKLTVSIGVAILGPGREERSSLMAAADSALYRAKEGGRNQVCTA
ncbi:GGDEF domain-containing protein [Pseudofulvimonas gallinarii]|uniref:diguanylate cyclase n=1 Tax=Pseudofulvimonas gallinarii TaxID=634155 RepID=A0A4V2UWL0_9GAMM|nr:GGDEF domain-containing protein [Pseudofulvimonas gallinarii]TCT00058.1 diguanylate cyclase (GGDEF)-like protein [Pseudofulvimonas gallinarii]